jgi:hypothetical protein
MTESIKDMGVSGKYTRMEHPTAYIYYPIYNSEESF